MCSHYQAVKERERYFRHFGVYPPEPSGKFDVWPGYSATAIRRPSQWGAGDDAVLARESFAGRFGLIPHWTTDPKIVRSTFNARSETAASKPSFRDAWRRGHHCIIPVEAFYEPDWRTGKAIATRISSADGAPMGLAGLWSWWKDEKGDIEHSFTMLTINADKHELMCNFHKPTDEKRMVVILPVDSYDVWLDAKPTESMDFMRQYSGELVATAGAAAPMVVYRFR
jgi:putative SOS response-associated peptidase YedK